MKFLAGVFGLGAFGVFVLLAFWIMTSLIRWFFINPLFGVR